MAKLRANAAYMVLCLACLKDFGAKDICNIGTDNELPLEVCKDCAFKIYEILRKKVKGGF